MLNNLKKNLGFIALIIGVFILIKGLIGMKFEYTLNPIVLFIFISLFIYIIQLFFKISTFIICTTIIVFLSLISGNIPALLAIFIITSSALCLGLIIFKILKIDTPEPALAFLLGMGFLGTLIGLGAHYPISYPGTFGILVILPFLVSWAGAKKFYFSTLSNLNKFLTKEAEDCGFIRATKILVSSCLIIYFCYVLLPELGFDALVYHLFIPSQLASLHFWGFDVEKYIWAVFPFLGDWIFSLAYVLSGETTTRILNYVFIIIGARLIYLIAKELKITQIGSYLCVLIYFANPLTFSMASTLYVESIWGDFFIAATLLILRLVKTNTENPKNFILIALLLGFSAATKMATLVVLPLTAIIILTFTNILEKRNIRILLVSVFSFCAVGLIPNVTAWLKTGNPFFFILNNIFASPFFVAENFTPPYTKGVEWNLFYNATFNTGGYLESYAGGIGFHIITFLALIFIALIASFNIHNKKFLLLNLICFGGIASIFITTSYVRYAYPFFILIGISIICGAELLSKDKFFLVISRTLIVIMAIFNIVFLDTGSVNYRSIDYNFRIFISKSKQREYVMQMNSLRIAIDALNQLNLDRKPVAFFSHPLVAGLNADAFFPNWYNAKFQNEIFAISDPEKLKN